MLILTGTAHTMHEAGGYEADDVVPCCSPRFIILVMPANDVSGAVLMIGNVVAA
jgi:hypothetical protein